MGRWAPAGSCGQEAAVINKETKYPFLFIYIYIYIYNIICETYNKYIDEDSVHSASRRHRRHQNKANVALLAWMLAARKLSTNGAMS